MKKLFTSILVLAFFSVSVMAECLVLDYSAEIKLTTTIVSFGGVQSKALALDGVPYQLTFEGKQENNAFNNCYVQYSTDGAKNWNDLVKPDCGTSYKSFGPYELPKNATHIRFNSKTGSTLSRTFRNIKVTCRPTTYGEYVANICEGDSVEYEGKWYYEAGTYENIVLSQPNMYDMDSIVNLTINILSYSFTDSLSIEQGADSVWHEQPLYLYEEGEYVLYDSLTTELGCDSVFVLYLTVNPRVPTALPQQTLQPAATKVFRNGVLYIRRDDALFDLRGQRVE